MQFENVKVISVFAAAIASLMFTSLAPLIVLEFTIETPDKSTLFISATFKDPKMIVVDAIFKLALGALTSMSFAFKIPFAL